MGDPAGIGPELTVQAWATGRDGGVPPFLALADLETLARAAHAIDLEVPIRPCAPGEAGGVFREALPVHPVPLAIPAMPGAPNPANAAATIAAIEGAAALVRAGEARAMVTNPIAKSVLRAAGFAHPGHTEFLGELAKRLWGVSADPVMLLHSDLLAVVPVTVHIPLARVPEVLTTARIVAVGRVVAGELAARFGLPSPRLAVAGLNPHAGEGGMLGGEDDAVVRPAVEALRALGVDARGPLPADTLFHAAARATYDVALCMYHDQALIPVKALAFDEAVNVSLGLPFMRTSPDHGTAFDLAGRGIARPGSLMAALRLAARLAGP